jgi:hypothetical protein
MGSARGVVQRRVSLAVASVNSIWRGIKQHLHNACVAPRCRSGVERRQQCWPSVLGFQHAAHTRHCHMPGLLNLRRPT